MNRPEVVSIGMVWDSERPSAEHVAAVYAALGTELRPTDAFHACVDRAWADAATHRLVGIVTYYGKHYSTFFFHSKLRMWIYFDDADVKEIGPEWSQVVDKCRRGRFQPLLLLYAATDGTPCDTRHAPRDVVPFPAAEPRRAITPAPERPPPTTRRALTPGPDFEGEFADAQRKAFDAMEARARRTQLARSLSAGSDTAEAGGRARRDSGNWSGDRNSGSSGSSTADSPYMYPRGRGPPGSPTRKGELSSGGSCDGGYDSYSLSSTDSLPLQQGLRHNLQLAQIPEIIALGDCAALCQEADRLLERSAAAETAADLETALLLCDAAASKARAAMEAPYNNPHTITFARMRHNNCVMRARHLQRRLASVARTPDPIPVRNTRSGIESSAPVPIEIYATLPKKKGSKKAIKNIDDDIEIVSRERPPRHKSRDEDKGREKRSRSEDRGRARKETPAVTEVKKEEPADDKKNKKQHKIRRKLMGGLIRRKNRSMPDLTEGADVNEEAATKEKRVSSVDDAEVGRRTTDDQTNLSGYLSEGHLEYSAASGTNPNLERSKLMRKSFHGSAGKMLTAAKVPPPPPLRTTSQLSGTKYGQNERSNQEIEEDCGFSEQYGDEPQSMPYNMNSYEDQPANHYDSFDNSTQNFLTVVTKAMIHQEQSPIKRDIAPTYTQQPPRVQNLSRTLDNGVDVVDCAPTRRSPHMMELPPYPSPLNSVNHSRQPSEEFPPPPSPINMTSILDELHRVDHHYDPNQRHHQYAPPQTHYQINEDGIPKMPYANHFLQELEDRQAKAAESQKRVFCPEGHHFSHNDSEKSFENVNSVRNMASRFESNTQNSTMNDSERSHVALVGMGSNRNVLNLSTQQNVNVRRASSSSIDPIQMEDDLGMKANNPYCEKPKKKTVSFCDQVILVSTAEDQEDDSYIPNPILERVLKSAMNKPELTTLPLQSEKPSLQRQESFDSQSSRSTISSLSQNSIANNDGAHSDYVRVQNYPSSYQMAQARLQQQHSAQKSTAVYGSTPPQAVQSQGAVTNNQIYQALPTSAPHSATPIPYTQPPVYTNNSSPPNFSQNPANRLTPTSQNPIAKQNINLPRNVPNTYPHPPSHLHQMNQPNNAYYHTLPQNSPPHGFGANRQPYGQYNAQNNNTPPYQSVPTNSPSYASYHNPPTSYSSSEYSSRYPQTTPQPTYQRVPPPHGELPLDNYNSNYQKMPNNYYPDTITTDARQFPNPHQQRPGYNQTALEGNSSPNDLRQYQYPQTGYNPYQHLSPAKQLQKKSVSFEPGTKGGTDSPVPPQMIPPYMNGDNPAHGTPKLPCNLCRKKLVNPPAMYCPDCDFYMSRFKPRS